MKALEVLEVSKIYGQVKALDSITFHVEEGEIFSLLGPNGAGKTTLMEIIVGIREPTSGTVRVFGIDVQLNPKEVSKIVGFNPQETMLYDELTGIENLEFFASLYGLERDTFKERIEELSDMLDVRDLLRRRVGKLSGGQKRRVSIIASILHMPKLLILDEPTVGLDPEARRDFWDIIWRLRDTGSTIVLSTHYMEEADELCDRVAIMDLGKIVAIDEPDDLKRMFGGSSKVIVSIRSRHLEDAEEALRELRPRKEIEELVMETDSPESLVPKVISTLDRAGLEPERVEIRKPTLEDVFLNLTGRRLEEVTA